MTTGVLCCEDLRLGRTLGSFYKSNGVWVDSLPLLLLYLISFNPFISLTPIISQKPSTMASHPPGKCCTIGVRHEGEAKGELTTIKDSTLPPPNSAFQSSSG